MKKVLVSLVCVFMVLAMMPAIAFANTSENTVATVGEKQYTSIQDALKDEAAYFGAPIKLTKDVELTEPLTINPERETVIDLDGHNLTTAAQDGILINVKQETGLVIVNGNVNNKAGNLKGKISADRNSAIIIVRSLFDEDISIDCANQENVKGLSTISTVEPEDDNVIEYIRTDTYSSDYDAIFWYKTMKNNEGIYFSHNDNADELAQIAGTDANFTKVANIVSFAKMDPELYVRLEKGDFSAYSEFQNALMNGVAPEINAEFELPVELGYTLNQALDKEEQHIKTNYVDENSKYLLEPANSFLADIWGTTAYKSDGWYQYVIQFKNDTNECVAFNVSDDKVNFDAVVTEDMNLVKKWVELAKPPVKPGEVVDGIEIESETREISKEKPISTDSVLVGVSDKKVADDILRDSVISLASSGKSEAIHQALKNNIPLVVEMAGKVVAKDNVDDTIIEKIDSEIEKKLQKGAIAMYLDLGINVKNSDGKLIDTITELDEPIEAAVALPDDQLKKLKKYVYVVREHDGQIDIIDAELKGNVLYFKTDRFSTYAVTSSDSPEGIIPSDRTSIRIFGNNRYDTSINVAEALKEALRISEFDNIIVADGDNYADALAGSYLAKVKNAPILVIGDDFGSQRQAERYIKENLSSGGRVYILGGTGAVPESFENNLAGYDVKRLAGSDRFLTNIAILKETGVDGDGILVCSGMQFADSLSASAVGKPVLLVDDKLTEAQKEYLKTIKNEEYFIIGGYGAVNYNVENEIKEYGDITRLSGLNRYETSAAVAEHFFGFGLERKTAVLAYGGNFPDGLSGGPLAMALGAPLVLVDNRNTIMAQTYILNHRIYQNIVLGGPTLISDEAVHSIMN